MLEKTPPNSKLTSERAFAALADIAQLRKSKQSRILKNNEQDIIALLAFFLQQRARRHRDSGKQLFKLLHRMPVLHPYLFKAASKVFWLDAQIFRAASNSGWSDVEIFKAAESTGWLDFYIFFAAYEAGWRTVRAVKAARTAGWSDASIEKAQIRPVTQDEAFAAFRAVRAHLKTK